MAFKTFSDAARSRFNSQWASLRPLVPVAWPGLPFDPANTSYYNPASHQGWVRFTILPGPSRQASISGGPTRWRTVGVIAVDLFCEQGKGTALAEQIADDIKTALQGVTLASVGGVLHATSLQTLGNDGQWYRISATTEFRYDDTVAA